MKKRTAEFVLGLIGGILGIILSVLVLIGGSFIATLGLGVGEDVIGGAVMLTGIIALVLSILGIVGAVLVKKKAVVGSILMLIAAIGGFICLSWTYIVSAVLFLIAGLLGLFRKVESVDNTVAK